MAGEPPKPERIECVDYLRGLAALSVLWFHFTNGDPSFLPDGLLKASGTFGYSGVAAFFVISGFIIPYSLEARSYDILTDGFRFLMRRLVRLEPPYLVSVVVSVVLLEPDTVFSTLGGSPPHELLSSLILHPFYLVPWFGKEWVNPVYWTLAIEFQYYIALLVCLPALFSKSWLIRTLFLCACLVLSLEVTDDRIFTCYLSLFGLGFLRYLRIRRGMLLVEVALWSAAFVYSAYHAIGAPNALVGVLTLAALSLRWPRLPPLRALGAISYSLYLLQVPVGSRVIDVAAHFPREPWIIYSFLALAVLLSVLGAWFFWLLVERPSIGLSKRIVSRERIDPSEAW